MVDAWHVGFSILALLTGAGYFLARRSEKFRKYVPIFVWASKVIQATLMTWNFKKSYKDAGLVLFKYSILLEAANFKEQSDVSKLWFAKFVVDTYTSMAGKTKNKEEAIRLANAVYVMLKQHADLLDTLKSFQDTKDIDVKKATLIAADFLGELVNIENKLDRRFYEHMVYGLNKALLQLKNGAHNKKTVAEISETMWRMYQIARAYSKQKSLSSLTKEQLMDNLERVLSGLLGKYQ